MEFREQSVRCCENIERELAAMGALLDNRELAGPTKSLPHFGALPCEESPEQCADTDVGEIISMSADRRPTRAIISVTRMIQGELHELAERHRTIRVDGRVNDSAQRRRGSEFRAACLRRRRDGFAHSVLLPRIVSLRVARFHVT